MKKMRVACFFLLFLVGCNLNETDQTLLQLRQDDAFKQQIEEEYLQTEKISANVKIEEAYYEKNVNFGGYDHNNIFIKAETTSRPVVELPVIVVVTDSYKEGREDSFNIRPLSLEQLTVGDRVVQDLIENSMQTQYGEGLKQILEANALSEGFPLWSLHYDLSDEARKDQFLKDYQSDAVGDWMEKEWAPVYGQFISELTISVLGESAVEEADIERLLQDLATVLPNGSFYKLTYTQTPVVQGERAEYLFDVNNDTYVIQE